MADVRLQHGVYEGDATLYFYDGELKVVNGIVTIPSTRPEWFTNIWRKGYQIDPETGLAANPQHCLDILNGVAVAEEVPQAPVVDPVPDEAKDETPEVEAPSDPQPDEQAPETPEEEVVKALEPDADEAPAAPVAPVEAAPAE